MLLEIVQTLEQLHPHWTRGRIFKQIADDNKGLSGFDSRTLYRTYQILPEMRSSHRDQTNDTRANKISTHDIQRAKVLVDQEELEKEKQKSHSLQIELGQKKQSISTLQDQLARAQTAMKNMQRDMQKAGKTSEIDQDEIEITIPRERPDGTILHRDITAIMIKKPPLFYIKAILQKKGKRVTANAIDVSM